jgi:predicted  nucleic acid-binding Zn-ribbon protein
MPRKKYDDNKLKDEMVALRRQGFSYRQIARQLGCSIYKVYELLSPYERPNARLKQAVELAEQLDKLAAEAQALNARFANLHKRLAELNVDDLKAQVSKANAQLRQLNAQTFHVEEMLKNEARELRSQIQALKASSEAIGQRLSQLEVTVAENEKKTLNLQVWINALRDTLSVRAMDFEEKVAKLENAIQWIYRTSAQRVEGNHACKHIDEEGYCRRISRRDKPEECRTKEIISKSQKLYILNVRDKPLICIACPSYKPK